MQVLVFRHVPFEGVGRIGPLLASRGIALEYADLYQGDECPPVSRFDGLIVMGGPMSANDSLPFLEREMGAIREAIDLGRPVLGICLGAQLTARVLGARVFRNSRKEIGWFDVVFHEAARDDRLFGGLPRTAPMFHWHGETFDLPEGAVLLSSSERCRHQAFRFGDITYGLQFHFEVTPAMIADWCTQDANCGDVRELDSPIDSERNADVMDEFSRMVIGRWCDLLAAVQKISSMG